MRNLKRALSLALASVMLLGMMVVGSSAKGLDDFSDNAEIVNKDAVAVTSAIGLFDGYEDGSFGPKNESPAPRWPLSSAPCCTAPA